MNISLTRAALAGLALCTAPVQAAITDPAGDFLDTFMFAPTGDLDVLSADVIYDINADTFTFTGTHAAPITTGAYVFGIDRGAGTVGLPAIANNVRFDSVVVLQAVGGSFIDIENGNATTPIPDTDITVTGSTISATVPGSLIPSLGLLAPTQYTWNLWPRFGFVLMDSYVSDFAPDNSNAPITAVPEAQTWALTALGIAFLGFAARRRSARTSAME